MSDQISQNDNGVLQAVLHDFRKQIDACILRAKNMQTPNLIFGRELALVKTKLEEAKMWGGKCLEVLGSALPAEFADKAEDENNTPNGM